jgi:hypothetical protein
LCLRRLHLTALPQPQKHLAIGRASYPSRAATKADCTGGRAVSANASVRIGFSVLAGQGGNAGGNAERPEPRRRRLRRFAGTGNGCVWWRGGATRLTRPPTALAGTR